MMKKIMMTYFAKWHKNWATHSLFFPKIKKHIQKNAFFSLTERVSEWEEKTKKEERNSRRMKEISQTSFYSFGALLRSPRKKKEIFEGDETLVFLSRVSECARVRASSWCGIHTFLFFHSLSAPKDVFLHF